MSDPTRAPQFATPVYIAANAGGNTSPVPPTPAPATIAGGGNWNSGIIAANGARSVAASAELSQAGTLTLQRYIDAAGTIAIGAAVIQALSANVVGTVAVNDGLPFSSFSVVVANSSGSVGNLTNVYILTSA